MFMLVYFVSLSFNIFSNWAYYNPFIMDLWYYDAYDSAKRINTGEKVV